jgi:hypothetical protein
LNKKQYFNLNPECFFVCGRSRSAVYNLDNGKITLLDKVQTKALMHTESKQCIIKPAEIYEYLAVKKRVFFRIILYTLTRQDRQTFSVKEGCGWKRPLLGFLSFSLHRHVISNVKIAENFFARFAQLFKNLII